MKNHKCKLFHKNIPLYKKKCFSSTNSGVLRTIGFIHIEHEKDFLKPSFVFFSGKNYSFIRLEEDRQSSKLKQ